MRPEAASASSTGPRTSPARREQISPNQRRRQDQIVEAAREVLVRYGVAGCTERRVAAAAGVAKNLVHYYFADMDVLIERAMAAHVEAFIDRLRETLDRAEPGDALTTLTAAYLSVFAEQPHAALLWFEFWIYCSRTGRLADLTAIEDRMVALLREALDADAALDAAAPPSVRSDRAQTAADIYVLLLGSVVDQATRQTDTADTQRRVRALADATATATNTELSITRRTP